MLNTYYLVVVLVDHIKHAGVKNTFGITSNRINAEDFSPILGKGLKKQKTILEMNTRWKTVILVTKRVWNKAAYFNIKGWKSQGIRLFYK